MATILERSRVNGPSVWEADIRVPGVDRMTATFATEAEANDFVRTHEPRLRRAKRTEKVSLPTAQVFTAGSLAAYYKLDLKATVLEYVEQYKPESPLTPDLRQPHEKCTERNWIHSSGALTRLGEVTIGGADKFWTRDHIAAIRSKPTKKGKPLAYATILNDLVVLKAACIWKANQWKINEPVLHFSTESFPDNWQVQRERRLEPGEHEAILTQIAAAGDTPATRQMRLIYELCIESAARLQELVLANWDEFDTRGGWFMPAMHTKKKWARFVPLSATARGIVEELRAMRDRKSSRVFHALPSKKNVSKHFARIFKRAGLVDFRFHDLRHEAISRMSSAVPNTEKVMHIVGHKTYKSLLRYRHFRPNELMGLFG